MRAAPARMKPKRPIEIDPTARPPLDEPPAEDE
jgi:hypothetical protein